MNYGNCCVASDIPENLEAIETYGFTFRNRDPDDLARLLAELIDTPGKVEEMRSVARDHVHRNYSWDSVADQLEALYLSLTKERIPAISRRN
jgi:glycosyltransferase involved in cell wall biosynthesis